MLLDEQEVVGPQMVVAPRVARVDRGGVDNDVRGRRAGVLPVVADLSRHSLEFPLHPGDAQVAHLEGDRRVGGVDPPLGGVSESGNRQKCRRDERRSILPESVHESCSPYER